MTAKPWCGRIPSRRTRAVVSKDSTLRLALFEASQLLTHRPRAVLVLYSTVGGRRADGVNGFLLPTHRRLRALHIEWYILPKCGRIPQCHHDPNKPIHFFLAKPLGSNTISEVVVL